MSTIRDLSTLIFGLSKREKAEFEQYASRQGSDQRYMRVYRVLDRMISLAKSVSDIPDEEVLTKRIRLQIKGGGNTAAYCAYLFKTILRSLRSSQESAKKEDDILQDINNARILARRGLFELAILSLENAIAEANLYEYHSLAIRALKELVYLEGQRDSKSYATKIREKLETITQLTQAQALEGRCFGMHHRAFLLIRSRRPVTHEEVQQELSDLKTQLSAFKITSGHSFFSQVYYWQTKASVANIEGEMEDAVSCSKKIVSLWQSKKYTHFQQEHPRLYIVHLYNQVAYAIASRQYDAAEKTLNTLERFPCANFDDDAEKFQNVLFSRQLLLLNTNRIGKAIEEVKNKLNDIESTYRSKINTARLISLYYNTLTACFVLRDYTGAQEWSAKIYKIGRTEQRRDIQFVNKVFQIIIRFELGQLHLLDNEIKNTTQNLRDHGQLDDMNALILHWLARLVKNRLDPIRSKEAMETTENTVFAGFREALKAAKEASAIGFDEVLLWVEGRIGTT